ncbi:type II secretion system GspH family protein [Shewanella schlegeliana]|uniref:Type II secretion system protein n=1 Tax=Shewanella schlegeliana TaxID=190308 RepID=A0ABS1T1C9_9GAMM|nr:type II secretion system protein [Shewanella schlegeliana]MBL4914395.1 type II secretion system protein [Shewanella schlegeliana]MCL1109381.1 type II secretion system GspH family protein [Shewanella schlegeliana]GIU31843.1 pilin [Shewanella schlegeliana]
MTRSTTASGFTLIEMVVVIIVLAILAVIAVPKFINLKQDAEIASIEATGGAFKGGITLANVKWASKGGNGPVDNLQVFGDGSSGQLDINQWGFPAQNYPPFESSPRLNNVADCMSVWRTVLQDAPVVSNNANTAGAEYLATYISSDQCRYFYLPEQTMSIYYDSRNGNVITDSDPNS